MHSRLEDHATVSARVGTKGFVRKWVRERILEPGPLVARRPFAGGRDLGCVPGMIQYPNFSILALDFPLEGFHCRPFFALARIGYFFIRGIVQSPSTFTWSGTRRLPRFG